MEQVDELAVYAGSLRENLTKDDIRDVLDDFQCEEGSQNIANDPNPLFLKT